MEYYEKVVRSVSILKKNEYDLGNHLTIKANNVQYKTKPIHKTAS